MNEYVFVIINEAHQVCALERKRKKNKTNQGTDLRYERLRDLEFSQHYT